MKGPTTGAESNAARQYTVEGEEAADPERIGVFGGTFDPVHNGHLHIAREVRQALGLDHIIWLPAGKPPHKRGQMISADRDRLTMLELALSKSSGDEISTIEFDRSGPSFTADTLEHLARLVAPAELVFIMGEDSLRDLPTWKDPQRILAVSELAVAGRPGVDADIDSLALQLPCLQHRLSLVPMQEFAVSSTEIRRRVAAGDPIDDLVPSAVAAYIAKHQLYQARGPS